MKSICQQCIHNCTVRKDKQGCISNKPKAICWCNANGGRVVIKKYSQCVHFQERGDNRR